MANHQSGVAHSLSCHEPFATVVRCSPRRCTAHTYMRARPKHFSFSTTLEVSGRNPIKRWLRALDCCTTVLAVSESNPIEKLQSIVSSPSNRFSAICETKIIKMGHVGLRRSQMGRLADACSLAFPRCFAASGFNAQRRTGLRGNEVDGGHRNRLRALCFVLCLSKGSLRYRAASSPARQRVHFPFFWLLRIELPEAPNYSPMFGYQS